jgi:hypothetical protein
MPALLLCRRIAGLVMLSGLSLPSMFMSAAGTRDEHTPLSGKLSRALVRKRTASPSTHRQL